MSSVELGESNLRNGKTDVAFDIFFELAQFELSADAQFALKLKQNRFNLIFAFLRKK
jgi:hypothetical protein